MRGLQVCPGEIQMAHHVPALRAPRMRGLQVPSGSRLLLPDGACTQSAPHEGTASRQESAHSYRADDPALRAPRMRGLQDQLAFAFVNAQDAPALRAPRMRGLQATPNAIPASARLACTQSAPHEGTARFAQVRPGGSARACTQSAPHEGTASSAVAPSAVAPAACTQSAPHEGTARQQPHAQKQSAARLHSERPA